MRSLIWLFSLPAVLLSPGHAAEGRQAISPVPRLGDIVPTSVRVIGVDGESAPRRYGMLIIDGRFIVLVEASSRKVVEVISDAPLFAPAPPTR
ncbi:hypothetical protein B6S44_07675 [Bosea sp. Tri-44]|uniref:hypothetical protein n=1 Tax=Bosea sp. Tri-44 TaxID=1972137 RepID=UPI0010100760|nr:hypothetical protein [Bosea sp. Tri-44]RXT55957.1 hypothetical protein B6S44_07675 [Bosea sp. Tri-44]